MFLHFGKMSYLKDSLKQTLKTCQFPDEEGYLAEKILRYKKKCSGSVGQLTKTINKIEKSSSKSNFSKIKEYDNSLDEIIL